MTLTLTVSPLFSHLILHTFFFLSFFLHTAQVLSWVCWLAVLVGIIVTILSRSLRLSKAKVKNAPAPRFWEWNQYELFLLIILVTCVLTAIGLTLSAFVNTSSLVF
jgi:uncharacterized protein YybS (DUF2232 family)